MGSIPKKILIADDDIGEQLFLKEIFSQVVPGLQVSTVTNGRHAIDMLLRMRDIDLPDMIILDFALPAMNAAEVLETLRREERFSSVRKIVLNKSWIPDESRRCLDAGANHILPKPDKASELKRIVIKLLETP
jgi:CheY-like chemotaxis protein